MRTFQTVLKAAKSTIIKKVTGARAHLLSSLNGRWRLRFEPRGSTAWFNCFNTKMDIPFCAAAGGEGMVFW